MIRRVLPSLSLAMLALLAGCASSGGRTPPVTTPAPAPEVAPRAVVAPERVAPAFLVVRPDELRPARSVRRQALVGAGRRVTPEEVGYYMDVQQARLQQVGGPWLSVIRTGHGVRLSLPGRWSFRVGGAELSENARSALSSVATVLIDYRLSLITVHGYTDDLGDAAFNQTLSEQRALAVARHLAAAGVATDRIVVVGHGAANPLASNASQDGREENRRVELQVDPLEEA
jgi:outer membrane protein OmpA-like peptidoglycan-associated protein